MSVYDLDLVGLRKTFIKFHKTLYGRTIFFLAYFIPFAVLLIGIVLAIISGINGDQVLMSSALNYGLAFVPLFLLANVYFYSEIRKFCEHLDSQKKK